MHLLEKPPRGAEHPISFTEFYKKPPIRGWPERACHRGVRSYHFSDFFPNDCAHFRGHLSKNVYVVMREGQVEYRRGANMSAATVGSALLIRPGEGEFRFFNPGYLGAAFATILEFDVRAVAGILGGYATGEALALQAKPFPEEGATISDPHPRSRRWVADGVVRETCAEEFLELLILHNFEEAAGLFRSIYYERRWELMRLLERHVLQPDALERIAAEYPGGAPKFRHDVFLFLGKAPEKWLRRRRIQLAEIWLRMGNSIPKVATRLGYATAWEFRCEFGLFKRCTCESVQNRPSLACFSTGELMALIRPSGWAAPRPLNPVLGAYKDVEDADTYTYVTAWRKRELKEDERSPFPHCLAEYARAGGPAPTAGQKRKRCEFRKRLSLPSRRSPHEDRAAEKLRELAPEFFAMESTGAELFLPIYQPLPK